MPDDQRTIWNISQPNSLSPGDVLSGAPGYGGQPLREPPALIVTEEHMAVHEAPVASRKPAKEKRPKVRAVLPEDASRTVRMPVAEGKNRVAINLRIPAALLNAYKSGGPKYQSRIIAVLELFVQEGGTFIEE
jgi:uncharacterized protein (DUF4415 family)